MKPVMDPEVAAARYAHGTHARYALAKCRCFPCKIGHSNYVYELAAEKRKPWRVHHVAPTKSWVVRSRETKEIRLRTTDRALAYRTVDALNKLVTEASDRERIDPKRVVKHIQLLQAAGVGYKRIAARADLWKGTVFDILSGKTKRVSRATAEAILSVSKSDIADGVKIDAKATWKMLDALLAFGFTKAELQRRIHPNSKVSGLQIRRDVVAAYTEKRVRGVYDSEFSANLKFRQHVDPIGEDRRMRRAEKAFAKAPQAVVLSKRDPDVARRWDAVFSEGSSAL